MSTRESLERVFWLLFFHDGPHPAYLRRNRQWALAARGLADEAQSEAEAWLALDLRALDGISQEGVQADEEGRALREEHVLDWGSFEGSVRRLGLSSLHADSAMARASRMMQAERDAMQIVLSSEAEDRHVEILSTVAAAWRPWTPRQVERNGRISKTRPQSTIGAHLRALEYSRLQALPHMSAIAIERIEAWLNAEADDPLAVGRSQMQLDGSCECCLSLLVVLVAWSETLVRGEHDLLPPWGVPNEAHGCAGCAAASVWAAWFADDLSAQCEQHAAAVAMQDPRDPFTMKDNHTLAVFFAIARRELGLEDGEWWVKRRSLLDGTTLRRDFSKKAVTDLLGWADRWLAEHPAVVFLAELLRGESVDAASLGGLTIEAKADGWWISVPGVDDRVFVSSRHGQAVETMGSWFQALDRFDH